MVEEGRAAPDFELKSDSGETVRLSDLRGKRVVLFFYPKDDTPGCTTQACGIRDAWGEFDRAGAVVLGVSPDDERSHVMFKEKLELPFALLADTEHASPEEQMLEKAMTETVDGDSSAAHLAATVRRTPDASMVATHIGSSGSLRASG